MIEGGGPSNAEPEGTLFGRTVELAQLESMLRACTASRGGLLCLAGEPGIGKTRLAIELTRLAESQGCSAHWGRTWEGGGAPPLWPWQQALRSLVQSSPNLVEHSAGKALSSFLSSEPLGATSTVPLPDGEAERFAWMVNLVQFLDVAARERPLLIVLEDIHAADLATLRILRFAARDLRGKRLLLAVTYRSTEARLRDEAADLLAQVEREGTVLHLGRLERTIVSAWVRSSLGEKNAPLEENVFSATMGNPLFVDEVLRLLAAHGQSAPGDRGPVPIPYGVRQIIRQRLEGLCSTTRTLLDAAAVIGIEVDIDMLFDLARRGALRSNENDLEPFPVEDALQEAERHDILLRVGPRLRRFSHALIQEVVNRDLTPTRRAALHLHLATALETRHQPPVEEVAHHYLHAETLLPDVEPLVTWTLRASEHRQQLLAHEDAIALLEQTREIVERRNNPIQLAEVLLGIANGWVRAGHSPNARPSCIMVADLARRAGSGALLARAALVYGAEFDIGLVDATLVGLLEEALALLPESEVGLRARVLARLAAALQPSEDPSGPMNMAREAIALARTTGDDEVLLSVLHNALASMMDFADARERLSLNREHLELARARGERARELRSHMRLVLDSLELGEWSALKGHATAFEGLVRTLRQERLLPIALVNQSMIAAAVGEFERSRELTAEAEKLYDPEDMMRKWLPLHRIGVERTAERLDNVQQMSEALVREWGHSPLWQLFYPPLQAAVATRAERRDDAMYWFSQIAPIPVVSEDITGSAFLMESTAYVGSAEEKRALLDRFRSHRGYFVSWGMQGQVCDGPVDRLLALLAASLEDWDTAEAFFASAEQQAAALGMRPILARILYERARERLRRGREEDRERASADLDQAGQLASSIPLPNLLDLIGRRSRDSFPPEPVATPLPSSRPTARTSVPPPRPSSAPGAESFALERQGEFWIARFEGSELHLKDSRGIQFLARLLSSPGKEFHVLDLSGSGVAEAGEIDGGDAGPMLDEKARNDYRRRLAELDETLDEAESMGDIGRAQRARNEREFLSQELSRAVGLGGRDRRTGAASERARVAVTRRLRDAIQRIAQQSAPLGRYLERSIRTGTYCAYEP